MRVAAIDIGTNSVLLLVAERGPSGLVPLLERATITRLGQGVDASRELAEEAVSRTLACLSSYAELVREAGVTKTEAVGTSAMRDARGGEAFAQRAGELLGTVPRVVSGDEEAALTFEGALSGLDVEGEVTVFDVGGGSTEVIVGTRGAPPRAAVSLDVGAVRLTERHIRSDPPSAPELDALRRDVDSALARAPFGQTPALVGVAGTVTTLAAHVKRIVPYEGSRVHGSSLAIAELDRALLELAGMTLAERRSLPAVGPGRADVIVAGALLVAELSRRASVASLLVSDRGVRWGIAERLSRAI